MVEREVTSLLEGVITPPPPDEVGEPEIVVQNAGIVKVDISVTVEI